jgi:Chlorophyll A-B binding protein
MNLLACVIAATATGTVVVAFGTGVQRQASRIPRSSSVLDSDGSATASSRGSVAMSEAIPFLPCPQVLMQSTLAGNAGFDPLGLAKSKEDLWMYREAEIKHARLAMLVC